MPVTFYRPRPWPPCRRCKREMDYWYLSDPPGGYIHDDCHTEEIADGLSAGIRDAFRNMVKSAKEPKQ